MMFIALQLLRCLYKAGLLSDLLWIYLLVAMGEEISTAASVIQKEDSLTNWSIFWNLAL